MKKVQPQDVTSEVTPSLSGAQTTKKAKKPKQELTLEEERKRVTRRSKSLRYTICGLIMFLIIINLLNSIMWAVSYGVQVDQMGQEIREKVFNSLSDQVYSRYRLTALAGDLIASAGSVQENETGVAFREFVGRSVLRAKEHFGSVGLVANGPESKSLIFSAEGQTTSFAILKHKDFSNSKFANMFFFDEERFSFFQFPNVSIPPIIDPSVSMINSVKNATNPRFFGDPYTVVCNYDTQFCFFVIPYYSLTFDQSGNFQSSVNLYFDGILFSYILGNITRSDAFSFIFLRESSALIGYSQYAQKASEDYQKYKIYRPVTETLQSGFFKADEYDAVSSISKVSKKLKSRYGEQLEDLLKEKDKKTSFRYNRQFVDAKIISVNDETESVHPTDVVLVHLISETAFSVTPIIVGCVAGVLAISICCFSSCLACCMCCCISRPMKRIIRQMKYAQDLQFDKIKMKRFAHFTELRKIQTMFYNLTLSLKLYRSFLPAHILQSIEFKTEAKKHKKDGVMSALEDEIAEMKSATNGSHSDRKSVASRSVISGTTRSESLHFTVGTISRRVTVVLVKLWNIDEYLQKTSPDDFITHHSAIVENINGLVSGHKGTLHSFTDGEFLISFNSVIACKRSHAQKGCLLAMSIKNRLDNLNQRFSQDGFIPLKVIVGVSTNDASVSILGTNHMKSQTVHGKAPNIARLICTASAQLMDRMNGEELTPRSVYVVLSEVTYQDISKSHILAHALDLLSYDIEDDGRCKTMLSYVLLSVTRNQNNKYKEWNYALQDAEDQQRRDNENSSLIRCWQDIIAGDLTNAQQTLEHNVLSNNPSHKLGKLIEKLIQTVNQDFGGSIQSYLDECAVMRARADWNSALLSAESNK